MTEAEWRACTDPAELFRALLHRAGPRKLRLLGCALARLTPLDGRCEGALQAAERLAEGELPPGEAAAHWDTVDEVKRAVPFGSEGWAALTLLGGGTLRDSPSGAEHCGYLDHRRVRRSARKTRAAAGLVRCVLGDLFRPGIWEIPWPPAWATTTAVALAAGIYADRAFDRLPVLADALEEAGCDDADLLAHCRGDGPHTRGCWVVDLVRWAK
jgi:hypothetical protein